MQPIPRSRPEFSTSLTVGGLLVAWGLALTVNRLMQKTASERKDSYSGGEVYCIIGMALLSSKIPKPFKFTFRATGLALLGGSLWATSNFDVESSEGFKALSLMGISATAALIHSIYLCHYYKPSVGLEPASLAAHSVIPIDSKES